VKPYFAVRGGVARTEGVDVTLSVPGAGLPTVKLWDESWVFTIGGDVGASMAISQNAEIGGEVGVRYASRLKEIDTDLNPVGLGGLNNEDSGRLSVPVSLRLNAVF
jgi:hypothetical protein